MSFKTRLESRLAPPPLPTFSPGVRTAGIVQMSGQGGADAQGVFASLSTRRTPPFMTSRIQSGILPARTTVFVGLPFPEMLVEIDALAVLED